MAQGDREKLRVVGGELPSAEEILRMAEPASKPNKLDVWLSQQDSKTSDLFWDTMKLVKERGSAFAPVLRGFLSHFPDAPAIGTQAAKKVVDDRLADS